MYEPDIVGVLTLQGDYKKHSERLLKAGKRVRPIRYPSQVEGVSALILPGGESTTIGKLLVRLGLLEPLRRKIEGGMPVFGTCAGAILLAKDIQGSSQARLGLLNATVVRNGYGRQVDSFEADVTLKEMTTETFRGVFIRAPVIQNVGSGVTVLGLLEDSPVLIRQGNMLAASFHPELTDDLSIHRYFLEMIDGAG
jgi:5'-phosphate synthase pdxT subunit